MYIFTRRKKVEKLNLDDNESSDEEVGVINQELPLQDDDGDEYNEEWEKFFKPNADDDGAYSNELIQNINEARSVVNRISGGYSFTFAGCWRNVGILRQLTRSRWL